MTAADDVPNDPRRAAIEEELRERLADDRKAAGMTPDQKVGPAALSGVGLMCLACRGLSSGDAHFCTRCGTRFNALVVATGNAQVKRGGAA